MGVRKLLNRLLNIMSNKRVPAAADRNKDVITSVLKKLIPPDKELTALEIASGSGLHASTFAQNFPSVTWIPSELDRSNWPSILAYKEDHPNMKEPIELDISEDVDSLEAESLNLIICINMIHISNWTATQGLFRNAGKLLSRDGSLITYGPYSKNGHLVPKSNVDFNRYLLGQNSEWGIRDIADLSDEGMEHGLQLSAEYDMPANNKLLVFTRNKSLG